jgi:hypothetical protein
VAKLVISEDTVTVQMSRAEKTEALHRTFAVCHGGGPAIVIDLTGERYDRIVLTLDNPEQAATQLS